MVAVKCGQNSRICLEVGCEHLRIGHKGYLQPKLIVTLFVFVKIQGSQFCGCFGQNQEEAFWPKGITIWNTKVLIFVSVWKPRLPHNTGDPKKAVVTLEINYWFMQRVVR